MTKQMGCNHKTKTRFAINSLSAAVIGLTSSIWASGTAALGLGDINLKSALDQNLDAEIQLLEVRELTEAEILVGLADQAAFERQGVDRAFFLTNIEFDVDLNARGGPVVRLTSDKPIKEPFLDFILEARWPSGKLLREYTVLLDLPVYAENTPAPVAPVQTQTVSGSSVSGGPSTSGSTYNNPRSSFSEGGRQTARSSGASSSYSGPSYSGDSYRVESNDTLWEIALSVRPDAGVSVHQTMMALHEANPEAFINGNINLLKSGKVLRIPDGDEIRSMNNRDAVRKVAQHNQAWSGSESAAPLEASNLSVGTQAQASAGEGRLSLLSPDNSVGASAGRVSGNSDRSSADAEALKLELAATQETLDKTQSENNELQSKIGSLEEQIRTLESMIQVSNESLRAMELAAAQGDDLDAALTTDTPEIKAELADGDGTTIADETDIADVDDSLAIASETDDASTEQETASTEFNESEFDDAAVDGLASEDSEAEDSAAAAAAAPAAETPSDPTKVVYTAPKKETGIFDLIKEYFLFIGLGIVALGAGILFFLKQRRDKDDFDEFMDEDFDFNEESQGEEPSAIDEEATIAAEEAIEEATDSDESLADLSSDDDEDQIEPETEDVVAESDIYIAYGKYDQAEEMLVKALNRDPSRHEARVKLLEIYSSQGNIEAFDANYAALIAAGAASSLTSRAEALRDNIPDAPPFDESVYATEEFESVDAPVAQDASVAPEEPVEIDENEFDTTEGSDDFDLTLDESDSLDTELNLAPVEVGDLEETLDDEIDLDLSLDELSDKVDSDIDLSVAELASEAEDLTDDGAIEFDLEGLDFGADEADDKAVEFDLPESLDDTIVAGGLDSESAEASIDLQGDDSDSVIELEVEDLDTLDISSDSDSESIDFDLDLDDTQISAAASALELGADLSEDELKAPSLQDELETDLGSIDFDLDELDKAAGESVSEELESESIEIDVSGDFEELAEMGDAATIDTVAPESDDTVLRSELDIELDDVEADLDLDSLDAELDELSANLGDSASTEAEDFASLDADLDLDEEPSSDESDSDLDATLAEGEQILAELEEDEQAVEKDAEVAELSDKAASDAPVFEEFDLDDTVIRGEDSDAHEPIESAFEEFDSVEEPADGETENASTSEAASDDLDFELPEIDPEATDDTDLDFLTSSDEVATKLDLAAAYIDMGDSGGAREILEEVLSEGDDEHKSQANALLEKINA